MFLKDVDVKEDADRNVTIDMPDGRRTTFYFNVRQQNQAILRAVWEAPPGVHATLEMLPDNMLIYDAYNRQILGFSHDYFDYHTAYEDSEVPGQFLLWRPALLIAIARPSQCSYKHNLFVARPEMS